MNLIDSKHRHLADVFYGVNPKALKDRVLYLQRRCKQ